MTALAESGVRLSSHVTVYRDPQYYCGPGPAAICDPDTGRLTVAFRRVPSWLDEGLSGHWHPSTESCLVHSDDGGATWTSPQIFLAGAQCPNLRRLEDGTLHHHTHRFELVNESIFAATVARRPAGVGGFREGNWPGVQRGAGVWRSQDDGITWGDPAWLKGAPGVDPLHSKLAPALAVRGNLLETASGTLLVSAYCFGQAHTSHLFASVDGGRNWSWRAVIADDTNETYLYQTDAGDIVAFLRRHSVADVLATCRSTDEGLNWSVTEPVCRGFPACAARLPSGRVLLAYGFRFDEGYGVRARVLGVDGTAASAGNELVLRDDGAVSDLGYPDAVTFPDGRVLVVFYHNSREDVAARRDPAQAPRFISGCILSES